MANGDEQYNYIDQPPQYQGSAGAYMPPRDMYGSSIVELTDPEEDLKKFELFLRSQRIDTEGNLKTIGDPLLNERGVNAVMASIESLVHHTNTLSNFSENAISFLMIGLADTITKDMMLNRIAYEVKRKNRDIILDNAIRFCYGFCMRAFEEGDRRFWKGSVQEVKHTQEINKAKGGNMLNPFSWGKNK